MTQILSVHSAFPSHRYPQAELTDAYARLLGLSPAKRALLDRLHRNCGVETRHTVLPLAEYGTLGGRGDQRPLHRGGHRARRAGFARRYRRGRGVR